MIRGMSFNKGIMFLGNKNIAITYVKKGKLKTKLKPINIKSLLFACGLVLSSMPLWFFIIFITWMSLIIAPKLFLDDLNSWMGLPYFTIIYFFFGTHFWFPREMRKYHGAEHKVFSYRGIISIKNQKEIKLAEITNRYCSTNGIVMFFLTVIILWPITYFISSTSMLLSLELATYISVVLWPLTTHWLHRMTITRVHRLILSWSYWLQRHITTTEPDDHHVLVAIQSYRRLALKEFPHRLIPRKKEMSYMAIADITVIPIGTESTSVSDVVAEIQRVLSEHKGVSYELTPMSTIIEGDIEDLIKVIRIIHEVPFKMGHKRVATNIRIDDRRDRQSSMVSKLESVQRHLLTSQESSPSDTH